MTWEFHADESTEGRHVIILSRDLLKAIVLYLDFSEQVISGGDRTHEVFTAPMLYMITYDYKYLNLKYHIKLEELCMYAYI